MTLRLLCCLLLVGALSACKSDSPETVSGPQPTSEITFKNTDNVLRVAIRQPPVTLLPYMTTQAVARYVCEHIFQTLNAQDPETLAQAPLLASVADVRKEQGGKVSYAYKIDESAKWPNGLAVTAADVIFSLKVLMNPAIEEGGPYRSFYYNIESIVTSPNDERRFRVVTSKPYLLAEQSIGSIIVLPEYAYDPDRLLRKVRLGDLTNERTASRLAESNEDLKAFAETYREVTNGNNPDKLIGSGPYRLARWEDDAKIVLERRDDYWAIGKRQPWLASSVAAIAFSVIPDPQTATNALRDENVDVVLDMSISQFKQIREDDYLTARYDMLTVPSPRYFGLLMNQRNPLFADVKVRRALAHLVDVDVLIEQIFPKGLAERQIGPVLQDKDYYLDLPAIDYNVDQANTLLTEAGWADSDGNGTLDKMIDGVKQELRFPLMVFPTPESEMMGTLVKEWAAEAGVTIESVPTAPGALYGKLNKGDFAMSLLGYGLEPIPDDFTQLWASTSVPPAGSNRGAFNNAEADRLIKSIRVTLDDDARMPMYERFQQIVYDEQPMIFLVSPANRLIVSKRFDYETSIISPGLAFNAFQQAEFNKSE